MLPSLLLLILNNSALFARDVYLDNKTVCEKQKGLWREFGNSCADNCYNKEEGLDEFCAETAIYSCQCGKNRCWYYDQCIDFDQYQIILDQQKAAAKDEEEKLKADIVEEAEKNQQSGNDKKNNSRSNQWQQKINNITAPKIINQPRVNQQNNQQNNQPTANQPNVNQQIINRRLRNQPNVNR